MKYYISHIVPRGLKKPFWEWVVGWFKLDFSRYYNFDDCFTLCSECGKKRIEEAKRKLGGEK